MRPIVKNKLLNNFILWDKLGLILAIFIFILALGFSYARIFYGIDFTDEAFLSALPYSLVLGNRPFNQELSLLQTSGILLQPFYEFFFLLQKGPKGIVLFGRHLYFLYLIFSAYLIFLLFDKFVNKSTAIICASIILPFSYFNILSLGYNTFGGLGFLCGSLLGTLALLSENQSKRLAILSALFHFSAFYTYPGFAPASILSAILIWLASFFLNQPITSKKIFIGYLVGFLGAGIVAITHYTIYAEPGQLHKMIDFLQSRGYAQPLSYKIEHFFVHLAEYTWALLALTLGLIVVRLLYLLFRHWFSRIDLLLLPIIPALLLWIYHIGDTRNFDTYAVLPLLVFALSAPILLLFEWKNIKVVLVILSLWIPSLVGFFGTSYCAAGGMPAAGHLGVLPAIIGGLLLLSVSFYKINTKNQIIYYSANAVLTAITIVGFQIHSLYGTIYRDYPIKDLTAKIESGPFWGIETTSDTKSFLELLEADLMEHSSGAKSILSYDRFPAAYLFTKLRPETPTIWLFWPSKEFGLAMVKEYYSDDQKLPDLVLQIKETPRTIPLALAPTPHIFNPLPDFLKDKGYRVVVDREDYLILKSSSKQS